MDIIKVSNLSKDYYQYKVFMQGKLLTRALKNVSFRVKKGDFFGLLGKNGAGKSTLLKILTTNLEKTRGSVLVDGHNLDRNEEEVKKSISWMFGVDYDGIGWSSVEKNLKLAAYFLGLGREEAEKRVKSLLTSFDLYAHRKLDVWRMSTGMQGKYSLCVAMLKDPKVLFLDEPLLGLDFEAKEQLRELLKKLNREGTTIVYTDQQLYEVEKLCKNVVMIEHGEKVYDGPMAKLKEKYRDVNILELRCRSPSINNVLHELKRKYAFLSDFELVESRDGVHEVRLFTRIDGARVLLRVGNFLGTKGVVVEKLNAGTLALEDVFRKFLRKDRMKDHAEKLLYYHTAHEQPRQSDEKYLRHRHSLVRGAACAAFLPYHTNVERTLRNMLSLTKEMKIASMRVIGDARLHHLAKRIVHLQPRGDNELQLHIALAMGKIGDVQVVETLMELLFEEESCEEVLHHLSHLDKRVLENLRKRVHALSRADHAFLLYHLRKHSNSSRLLALLHLTEAVHQPQTRRARVFTRYGKS